MSSQVDIRVVGVRRPHRALESAGALLRLRSMQRVGMECLAEAIDDDFEIVNGHNYYANWPAARVKSSAGIPAVWMCNEPPFWYHTREARYPLQRGLEGAFLRIVDRPAALLMDSITVLDEKNAARVKEYYGMNARVVRSGVDAEFFDSKGRTDLRAELGLEGKFVLLLVGHASRVKGQADALAALRLVREEIPNAHLVMVGGGVKWMYGPLASSMGLADKLTLLEGVTDDYLASLYATADVVLFPANQTWGLNITEAMAAGRPVVVADQAGVSEIVEPGVTGVVVPYGNAEAIAGALSDLHDDGGKRKKLGLAGREYVRAELTWSNYARRMLEVYEDCLRA